MNRKTRNRNTIMPDEHVTIVSPPVPTTPSSERAFLIAFELTPYQQAAFASLEINDKATGKRILKPSPAQASEIARALFLDMLKNSTPLLK